MFAMSRPLMVIKHENGNFVLYSHTDGLAVLESAPPTRFVITMLARHATMHNDMMIARDSKQQLLVKIITKDQLC
jgi:hypothetical protein